MGNSLQEELLKAGLVTEEQLREANKPAPRAGKRKRRRPRGQARGQGRDQKQSVASAPVSAPARHELEANKRRTARFAGDPMLGARSSGDNARKELKRRIRELVEGKCLNDAQAEQAYHFVKGKRIKRIFVTEEQRARLMRGELAIVAVEGNHYLLANETVDALLGLAPESFVFRGNDAGASEFSDSESGEHPVPDDLTW